MDGSFEQGQLSVELASRATIARLKTADESDPLGPADLERLAVAAFLTGEDSECVEAWTRAFRAHEKAGRTVRAARCGFWAGFVLMNRDQFAQAGGWFAEAGRLLDEGDHDVAERGLLMIPDAVGTMFGGDPASALEMFSRAASIGKRFKDRDLIALSVFGSGQCLVQVGQVSRGVASLDEAMVTITRDDVMPLAVGIVYCGVIATCYEVFDVRRAQEWTDALTRWCERGPDLVPFRGQCLVHRAQLLQMRGAWPEALAEATRALERLSTPPQPAVGLAFYELGELHRLRGETTKAEEAYRGANEAGFVPHPGLAMLRLARGQRAAARASMKRAIEEASDSGARFRLLPAYVEIMIAVGALDDARSGSAELTRLAEDVGAAYVRALAAHARGAVALAGQDAQASIVELRAASALWHTLEAPYETARTRALLAEAYRALGDNDGAEMEADGARRAFASLGAKVDLALLERHVRGRRRDGLTARELEVLRLIAAGMTNRAIADALVISEKTVARHISNMFTKLGLSTRAAVTAYAYRHDLAST